MRYAAGPPAFPRRFLAAFLIAGQLDWGLPALAIDTLRPPQEAETRASGLEEALRSAPARLEENQRPEAVSPAPGADPRSNRVVFEIHPNGGSVVEMALPTGGSVQFRVRKDRVEIAPGEDMAKEFVTYRHRSPQPGAVFAYTLQKTERAQPKIQAGDIHWRPVGERVYFFPLETVSRLLVQETDRELSPERWRAEAPYVFSDLGRGADGAFLVDLRYRDLTAPDQKPESSVAAGLEEAGETSTEEIAAVAQTLEKAGIRGFSIRPQVVRDPALWRQLIRELPNVTRDNPDAVRKFRQEGGVLPVGWGIGLRMIRVRGEKIAEVFLLEADVESPLEWVRNDLQPRALEMGPGLFKLEAKGVRFLSEEDAAASSGVNADWSDPLPGLVIPPDTWGFLKDRGLELVLNIPPTNDHIEAWKDLAWALDPRMLRRNIPLGKTRRIPTSPVPLRGSGKKHLSHLRGYLLHVELGQESRATVFQIQSSRLARGRRHPILSRSKGEFLLEYWRRGYIRPGPFGWKRIEIKKQLDRWFGADGWKIMHLIGNEMLPEEAALQLYEDAYKAYFQAHTDELEALVARAKNIYDTSPSNVGSGADGLEGRGMDYSAQETDAQHLHDIAIRRVLRQMDRWFQGEELLEIRGPKSAGFRWNPGKIPFHRPLLIPEPALKGWWDPGSVEEFYQSTKVVVLTRDPTGMVEWAVRALGRFISEDELNLSSVAHMEWKLDPRDFPRDEAGNPRPFSLQEMRGLLHEVSDIFMASSEWLPDPLRRGEQLQEMRTLHRALENGRVKLPDVEFIRSHIRHLPALWEAVRSKKAIPVILARDALTLHEFSDYLSKLRGEPYTACVLYQPGSPLNSVSRREKDSVMEHAVFKIAELGVAVRDQMISDGWVRPGERPAAEKRREVFSEFRRRFVEGVDVLLENDPQVAQQAERIYQQFRQQDVPDGAPLVVVDSNATGRTALFVAASIEKLSARKGKSHSAEILLGWARDKSMGIPEMSDRAEVAEQPFGDLHWPFRFDAIDPATGDPIFLVHTSLFKLALMVYQSMEIYNAAVRHAAGLEEGHLALEEYASPEEAVMVLPAVAAEPVKPVQAAAFFLRKRRWNIPDLTQPRWPLAEETRMRDRLWKEGLLVREALDRLKVPRVNHSQLSPQPTYTAEGFWKDASIRVHGTFQRLVHTRPNWEPRLYDGSIDGGSAVVFSLENERRVFIHSSQVSPEEIRQVRALLPRVEVLSAAGGWFVYRATYRPDGQKIRKRWNIQIPSAHIDGVLNAIPWQADRDRKPILLVDPGYAAEYRSAQGEIEGHKEAPWDRLAAEGLVKVVEADTAERHLNPANFILLPNGHILMNKAPKTAERLTQAGMRPEFLHLLDKPVVELAQLGAGIGCWAGIADKSQVRSAAGLGEKELEQGALLEQWQGMRSAAPELRTVVIGRSVADRFPALRALAGLGENFLVDEGDDTVVRLVGWGVRSVAYYGEPKESGAFAALAGEALIDTDRHLITEGDFLAQLEQVFLLAGIPQDVLSTGLEEFATELDSLAVGV